MKRYALFTFDQYYPSGGWNDLEGTYDSVEEATSTKAVTNCDWWHIIDLTDGSEADRGQN